MNIKTVALIFGGPSAEHDVSLVSAKNIYTQLKEIVEKVVLLGVTKEREWKLIEESHLLSTNFEKPLDLTKVGTEVFLKYDGHKVLIYDQHGNHVSEEPIDLAFPIIHGPYGEDGELQNMMSEWDLPFVGSASAGCAHAFDKGKTKNILKDEDVPQASFLIFEEETPSFKEIEDELGLPVFVKPANMGSSLGISKVKSEQDWEKALSEAKKHDKKILVEKAIQNCREIECALLETESGLQVSGLGEIKPSHEFYSYDAKYIDPNGAELIIPAVVDAGIEQKIQDLAKKCFEKLGCRDYARADFFIDTNNEVFFNEINTHPGFTDISMFPSLWAHEGIKARELVSKLIDRAKERMEKRI
jgi:D-alanine-D-alanine ligase